MATYGFQSTWLWTTTLATVAGDRDTESREHLRSAFLRARETTGVLPGELGGSVPEYTVHDLTHADALWETASLLIGRDVTVNPVEGFVLGMAFLLHDAAMGLAAYQGGPAEVLGEDGWLDLVCSVFRDRENRWPTEQEMVGPPPEVVREATSTAIREAHARQAGVLVETPWTAPDGTPHFLLDDIQLRGWYGPLLAELVESHWWSVDRVSTHFRRPLGSPPWLPDWPLDPLKLACLLRLADATQIDARRAPTLLMVIRQPAAESRLHWRFQQYVHRPQLRGDRMTYTCSRPFDEVDAPAWWLALDYLGSVDRELRMVDDLLHDLDRPRFAARGVANVGTPARFAELFPVRGWRPVDADIQVSDVHALVAALGGEQLYGRQPEVAVRELLQNAHDAVLARRALEPGFEGSIEVALAEDGEAWTLTVRDDGIGMDEDMLVQGLMDFGRSGWRTRTAREKFSGLMSGGFRPKGRFGIGFFSVFMLGDQVEVTSRRYDLGRADARRLTFDGLSRRPLMAPLGPRDPASSGTTVRIRLQTHPQDRYGLLSPTEDGRLDQLVLSLMPESGLPISVVGPSPRQTSVLSPFDLASADAASVFDRLYPPAIEPDDSMEHHRQHIRAEFIGTATDLRDSAGTRIGLAVVGTSVTRWFGTRYHGITTVNGFTADRWDFFTGYMQARPGRASRDQAQLAPTDASLGAWFSSQEDVLREAGLFTIERQFLQSAPSVRAGLTLRPDHHVAVIRTGPLELRDLAGWAAGFDEIFIAWGGWPLSWDGEGPYNVRLSHTRTGERVVLPEGWILPLEFGIGPPLDLALDDRRDAGFEWARYDHPVSWQRRWYALSDGLWGLLVTRVAAAWSCTVEQVLAPCAARRWNDAGELVGNDGDTDLVGGFRLRRPGG